ncbi:glycosyltransferase [Parabacteroides distasonis]|uniref:glycosyltransferase n=1 Tax=Parabacteroides distasonis TaxID=823 RepID=UPI001C3864A3|nr:glycosyltransferase [Parabacteroides distasonis]MBV4225232.1 glycosyltransferase [Parabacteroides distasonis]
MELSKEKNFVSAVVYCHNEADTIKTFIENLNKTLNDNFLKYEIIVVNGACTDNTMDIIKEYAKTKSGLVISILNLSIAWGAEYGINSGIDLSIGDYVFEFDSPKVDYDWSLLIEMYHKSQEGNDFVCAVSDRKVSLGKRIFYTIINRNAPLAYNIGPSTFRLLSRRGINHVRSITKAVASRKISYAKCGLPLSNVRYVADKTCESPLGSEPKVFTSILLYTSLGSIYSIRLVKATFLFLLLSILYSVGYTVYTGNLSVVANMIVFITICFAGVYSLLSIIALYLKAVIDFVFKKKDAIFVSIEKLANQ